MIETTIIIVTTSLVWLAIIFILYYLGKSSDPESAKDKMKPLVSCPPTRETLYADHVINTAAQIYCNYNESKIIRPGASTQPKKQRCGEALQEALNLVGAAYRYFDMKDMEDNNSKENFKIN
jgi:hypothetical protein